MGFYWEKSIFPGVGTLKKRGFPPGVADLTR
jgi:hypothetical protein